jgi:hypothetical protein
LICRGVHRCSGRANGSRQCAPDDSSGRNQRRPCELRGPIRRAACFERRCSTTFVQPQVPVIMGPLRSQGRPMRNRFSNSLDARSFETVIATRWLLAMTSRHSFAISRPDPPEVCQKIPYPPIEGAGNAGRPMRPIAACAMSVVERTRVSQVTPESPGIPRAMVLRLIACSPRRPGSFATVARAPERELDASIGASGPHVFAVRKKAPSSVAHLRPPHPASRP